MNFLFIIKAAKAAPGKRDYILGVGIEAEWEASWGWKGCDGGGVIVHFVEFGGACSWAAIEIIWPWSQKKQASGCT